MFAFEYQVFIRRFWSDTLILLVRITLVMFGLTGSMNSADGQGSDTTRLIGPDFFVTDGTRDLNLTCQTLYDPRNLYVWSIPGLLGCPSPVDNNCTFRPRLEDDMQKITCAVQNSNFLLLGQASYQLNLHYPPPEVPRITMDSSLIKHLKQGDTITCTVSRGKPPVTNITFECQNPYQRGQHDGNHTVSIITVNTSLATTDTMNCSCFAHWDPEPALYSINAFQEFVLEGTSVEDVAISGGAVAGIVVVVVVLLVVVVITILWYRTRHRQCGDMSQQDTTQDQSTKLTLSTIVQRQPPQGPRQQSTI